MADATRTQELKISDSEFEKFRDFFYRKTGIFFEDSKRYFVDKRILTRIEITKCDNFREYFTKIRFQRDESELQQLINMMTVNETYFFREAYQFDCMVSGALDSIIEHKNKGDVIRIWSLPSSTGEEAYSIAIYLLEKWPHIDDYQVELFASDIDTSVLDKAREGLYNSRSIEGLPREYLSRYFEKQPCGRFQASDDLRNCVEFTNANVVDLQQMNRFQKFDIVFCRNLLIYFDDKSRRQAAEAIYESLNPGGLLFLGHSESMSRICSLFKVIKFPETIAYQKAP